MNKGYQKKTVKKYLDYLLELLYAHKVRSFDKVILKDKALLSKYFPNNKSDLDRPYRYMIKFFTDAEIITGRDDYYLVNEKSYLYSLDVSKLIEIDENFHTIPERDSGLAESANTNTSVIKDRIRERDKNRVRFGRLFLNKNYTDDEVMTILYTNYDQLRDYELVMNDLKNNKCTWNNLFYMQPKIRRGKKGNISSIGIRATQLCCSMTNYDKHPGSNYKLSRQYFLDQMFGEWEGYDVKGSVPRLARFLNCHEWLPAETDPYYEMFHDFDFKSTFEDGEEGWTEHNRDISKSIFMLLYFGGTASEITRSVLRSGSINNVKIIDKSKIDDLKSRVKKFCGSDDRKETVIFLHESCIYLDVMHELMTRNIDVYQVYDGFYFKKGTMPADMDDIIKNAAINYFLRYSE